MARGIIGVDLRVIPFLKGAPLRDIITRLLLSVTLSTEVSYHNYTILPYYISTIKACSNVLIVYQNSTLFQSHSLLLV